MANLQFSIFNDRRNSRPGAGFCGLNQVFVPLFRLGLRSLFIASLCAAPLAARAAKITVFAAASLTDSLKAIAQQYQKETGNEVVLNLGGSSTLERQIQEGAPADIFFSADEAKMNRLEKEGLIESRTRQSRLSNSLAGIVFKDGGAPVHSPQDLTRPEVKRVALADPKAVPAGIYAREFLQSQGLWDSVAPKVVATENVRAALAAVEAGDADASIVYKTDAMISKRVKIAFEVPAAQGPKIRYPMALVKGANVAAKDFLRFLGSDQAAAVFKRYGFRVLDKTGTVSSKQ